MSQFKHILVLVFAIMQLGCSGKASNKDSVAILTNSTVVEKIKIERFDSLLYKSLNNPELVENVVTTYPSLLSALGSITINKSDINQNTFYQSLSAYFKNEFLYKMYSDALSVFRNVDFYENELSAVNNLIKEKYNGRSLPNIAIHVSGLKANTIVTDNQISISIDKYLGSDYSLYLNFFEQYQRTQMQPKFVTRDIVKAWIIGEIPPLISPAKTLLDEMVYEGKILYALSELLPEWNKYDLIGYNESQFQWCLDNENNIWTTIIQQKHLYNDEYFLNQKYIIESPYTSTISPKSPGRIGCWIGWRIVDSFAKNTGKSIKEILEANDAQIILKEAKYNPIK